MAKTLSDLTLQLYSIPPHAQRAENICSMVNFCTEAKQILQHLQVSRIVEIGCEAGLNSSALLSYVNEHNIKLDTVDPADIVFPFDIAEEKNFTFHKGTSTLFLDSSMKYEVIFMDGDHNYETVYADLNKIHAKRSESGVKVIFMHDISWPWARRDIYYNLEAVKNPLPNSDSLRISPYQSEQDSVGLPPNSYAVALEDGGKKNGVLTAVEDFIETCNSSWVLKRFPVLYGIGVLYCVDNLDSKELQGLETELESLGKHQDLLSIMEVNRIENLCLIEDLRREIERAGKVWCENQAYIGEVNKLFENGVVMNKDSAVLADKEKERLIKQLTELQLLQNRWKDDSQKLLEVTQLVEAKSSELSLQQIELNNQQVVIKQLKANLWCADQQIRRSRLNSSSDRWRYVNSKLTKILPYSLRNRKRLQRVKQLLQSGAVKTLSLDVFDTVLMRENRCELQRFMDIGKLMSEKFPKISATDFYYARVISHNLAYRIQPVIEGCREATFDRIVRILCRIINLKTDYIEDLKQIELDYEMNHLSVNPEILQIIQLANSLNIRVIAVSDMYLNAKQISMLFPEEIRRLFAKVYSSSDFGIPKVAGLLWDRIVTSEGCNPHEVIHIGDNFMGDFHQPFIRNGIQAVYCMRSSLYKYRLAAKNKQLRNRLFKRKITHGL